MKPKFLLGLTTTPGADYLGKIEEINKFDIKEIAFFPTAINQEKRKDLYALLEQTSLESIPHVHLREDMEIWELQYLQGRFGTQVFNIHSKMDVHPFVGFKKYLGDLSGQTYLENTSHVPGDDELKGFGGLCIDFSHWEDGIRFAYPSYDDNMKEAIKKFHVGCGHISAISKTIVETADVAYPEIIYRNYSIHLYKDLSQLDYVKKYIDYFPDLISLELENSFEEQLRAKEYLQQMLEN